VNFFLTPVKTWLPEFGGDTEFCSERSPQEEGRAFAAVEATLAKSEKVRREDKKSANDAWEKITQLVVCMQTHKVLPLSK
jgi:hypothetical protein